MKLPDGVSVTIGKKKFTSEIPDHLCPEHLKPKVVKPVKQTSNESA